jgi:prolyl-tRNA editing enzyme YbaK/EbsC (Cys-tRNA(Pro) deacylase)
MKKSLQFHPAINQPQLVAPSVTDLLQNWSSPVAVEDIWVAEIDPAAAGGNDFCTQYGIPFDAGANCVVIEAVRNEKRTLAACVALVGYQMNFNGIIRKTLNARKVSLAPLSLVLEETKMEFGSITPFGLPSHWPILIDARILDASRIVIGSGLIKSKLSLPSQALANLAGSVIVEALASKIIGDDK